MSDDQFEAAPGYDEPSPILEALTAALEDPDAPRWLELVDENQTDKFARLIADLQLGYSATGDGKRITCGYAHMGIESTLAWRAACGDLLYPVMQRSIEKFEARWSTIRSSLGPHPYHYVSLSPGDGQKDAVILRDLQKVNPRVCYIPVDSSTEMLRMVVRDLLVQLKFSNKRILALPWDFSMRESAAALRRMLDGLFGTAPVLFSLLGNKLANYDEDVRLLQLLATALLRPQDRFLLEVATTPGLNDQLAAEAALEYQRSHSFGEFVTSALHRYTDLHVDKDSVLYQGNVEDDRALLVKMIYQNQTGQDIQVKLPYQHDVKFRPEDTIRLLLTRKYAKAGLDALLSGSGMTKLMHFHSDFPEQRHHVLFGMCLMTLERRPATEVTSAATAPTPDIAQAIWRRRH